MGCIYFETPSIYKIPLHFSFKNKFPKYIFKFSIFFLKLISLSLSLSLSMFPSFFPSLYFFLPSFLYFFEADNKHLKYSVITSSLSLSHYSCILFFSLTCSMPCLWSLKICWLYLLQRDISLPKNSPISWSCRMYKLHHSIEVRQPPQWVP